MSSKRTVILTEEQFKTYIKQLLNERLSAKLYHFTDLRPLLDILQTNTIKLQSQLGVSSDSISNKNYFYLSLTRNRDSNAGYSRNYPVRIEFDGDKLNNRFGGRAISYWGSDMGKNAYMDGSISDSQGNRQIPYVQSRTENEDRLMTNQPVINNAMDYITRIDVLLTDNVKKNNMDLIEALAVYHNRVFIYDNPKDFNFQTEHTVNDDIDSSLEYSTRLENRNGEELHNLETVFNVMLLNVPVNDRVNYIVNICDKYGFEPYKNQLVKKYKHWYPYNSDKPIYVDELRGLHRNTTTDEYRRIMNMFVREFMKKYNLHNRKDIINFVCTDQMKLNEILKNVIKENISKVLLNEITIKDKYELETKNGKTNLSYAIYYGLCLLDPTTKNNNAGKYCNWILQHYNGVHNLERLKVSLEQFSDGVKRGILKQHGINTDINSYKSYDELIRTIDSLIHSDDADMSQSEYNNRNKLNGQYKIVGSSQYFDIIAPKTFEAERYFGSHTEWCTVANKDYYNKYIEKGQLYILYPKDGDYKKKMQFHFESESFATYGDNVLDTPRECICTVLKNDDEITSTLDLCYKVFTEQIQRKDYKMIYIRFDEVQRLLNNGENPRDIFDTIYSETEGISIVELNNKYNFIDANNKLISDTWFTDVYDFENGCAWAKLNSKWSLIDINGNTLSDAAFDDVYDFENGIAKVKLGEKFNFIKENGKLISDIWFDDANSFYKDSNGFTRVKLNNVWYYIDREGKLYGI